MSRLKRVIPAGVVAAASALIAVGVVAKFLHQNSAGDWSTLPGAITKVEVIPGAGVDGRWMHKLDLEYEYNANGVPYTGTRLTSLGELSVWLRGGPKAIEEMYEVGTSVPVYVPRSNAHLGILEPGLTRVEFIAMVAGGGLPALLTLMMFRSVVRTLADDSEIAEHSRIATEKEVREVTVNPFNRGGPAGGQAPAFNANPFGVSNRSKAA